MQHRHGEQLHRTTLWRRKRKSSAGVGRLPGDAGRRQWSEFADDVWLRFTAAVIGLQNRLGHVHWPDLVDYRRGQGLGFNAPRGLLARLQRSGYPAAMMATAVCEVIPLNLLTRGGPGSSDRLATKLRARRDHREGMEGRLRRALHRQEYTKADLERALAEAHACDYRADWIGEMIREDYHLQAVDRSRGSSSKGTPVHRIPFPGLQISRKMASYWRTREEYPECRSFIEDLVETPIPRSPYVPDGGQMPSVPADKNAEWREYWRARLKRQRTT